MWVVFYVQEVPECQNSKDEVNASQLLSDLRQTVHVVQRCIQTLEQLVDTTDLDADDRYPRKIVTSELEVDDQLFEVRWKERCCSFGPVLPFHLFAYLARNPDQYITYQELLLKVWGETRSREAVRSVVADLRMRLRGANMKELADAIDGRCVGRYGLILRGV